jgi:DNA-binding transcriptional MerR regulator
MDNRGYQAFRSTYDICTERLEEFEGENAIEAKRICDKYLDQIKATFKEAGFDLDSIRETHAKQKESDMKILEDFQKFAEAGQLQQVVEEMREVRKTCNYVFGTWKAFSDILNEWEKVTNQPLKELNVMKKLGNGGFKTVVLMNEICARKLENFKGSEKTKAKKVCKQVEQLYKDVVKKE